MNMSEKVFVSSAARSVVKKRFGFNVFCDLHVVDPVTAGVNLREAYVHGHVSGDLSVGSTEFNDVEDPSSLMPRPSDVFEGMRQAEGVKSSLSAKKAAAEAAASSSAEN